MWEEAENGWIVCHPSERARVEARNVFDARQALTESPNLFDQAEGDDRWVGDLAELGFEHWLRTSRLPSRHYGGLDLNPDFAVAGLGVGLKCRTANVRFKPHFVVNVPDAHMRRPGEAVFFFAAYEEPHNRLLLLGSMSRSRLTEIGTRTMDGEQLHHGLRAAAGACWSVEARELAAPAEFLAYMRTRIAA